MKLNLKPHKRNSDPEFKERNTQLPHVQMLAGYTVTSYKHLGYDINAIKVSNEKKTNVHSGSVDGSMRLWACWKRHEEDAEPEETWHINRQRKEPVQVH